MYRAGIYVYPTNARLDLKHFAYKQKDASLPDNQFEPPLSSISGANYYDRDSHLLYVVVKGSVAVDIKTAPVIQVKMGKRVGRMTSSKIHAIEFAHKYYSLQPNTENLMLCQSRKHNKYYSLQLNTEAANVSPF